MFHPHHLLSFFQHVLLSLHHACSSKPKAIVVTYCNCHEPKLRSRCCGVLQFLGFVTPHKIDLLRRIWYFFIPLLNIFLMPCEVIQIDTISFPNKILNHVTLVYCNFLGLITLSKCNRLGLLDFILLISSRTFQSCLKFLNHTQFFPLWMINNHVGTLGFDLSNN